jgi:hypothetical protein
LVETAVARGLVIFGGHRPLPILMVRAVQVREWWRRLRDCDRNERDHCYSPNPEKRPAHSTKKTQAEKRSRVRKILIPGPSMR